MWTRKRYHVQILVTGNCFKHCDFYDFVCFYSIKKQATKEESLNKTLVATYICFV